MFNNDDSDVLNVGQETIAMSVAAAFAYNESDFQVSDGTNL